MNIIIYTLVIFGIIYFLLKLLAKTSSRKISKHLRKLIFIGSIVLAILLAVGGKFILSIPLTLLSLAIVKLKGFSIIQLIGLFRLIQTLRRSGRFSFNQNQNIKNSSTLSLEESYKILNLDINKKITKKDVSKAYVNIQKKIHPDVSPETARLSTIVNEAKEIVLMADTPLLYGSYSPRMYPIIPDGENTVIHNTLGKDRINPYKIFKQLNDILD